MVDWEEQGNTFQKVVCHIRRESNLKVPEPEVAFPVKVLGLEELWASLSSAAPSVHLPMSRMVMRMLQAVEFEVTGLASSLASKRSLLLPLFSCKKQ